MRLISVCLIEQEYVDDQFVLKRQDGTEIPRVPASQPSPATYIKSTLRDGYKLFLEETRKLAAQDPTSPVYFIIDDIFTLGSTIEAISASIRDLRCFVEDHFSVAKWLLFQFRVTRLFSVIRVDWMMTARRWATRVFLTSSITSWFTWAMSSLLWCL